MIDKLVGGGVAAYGAAWAAVIGNGVVLKFTAALWMYRHALESWMQ